LSTAQFTSRKAGYIAHNPELGNLKWLAADQAQNEPAKKRECPTLKGDDIAFLQYTSGSTADPKGVIVTHANLMANQAMIAENFGMDSETIYVNWLPLYHDMGLLGPVMTSVYLGCRSIKMAPAAFLQKPIRWLKALSRYKCTFTAAPNFAYDLCVRATKPEQRQGLDLSSLQGALNAAEPVRVETMERFIAAFEPCGFRLEMFAPTFGLAEATLFVTGASGRPIVQRFSSSPLTKGKAIPVSPGAPESRALAGNGPAGVGTGVHIVDPETFITCEPGRVGEIWVRGPHVSTSWNKSQEARNVRTLASEGAAICFIINYLRVSWPRQLQILKEHRSLCAFARGFNGIIHSVF
jgi:acyl-CoA synthetase (AMP-forming)/AMP-acid ligase II